MRELQREEKEIVHRILDANANRCAEGLRVIEEIARFGYDDRKLVEEIKSIRHEVRAGVRKLAVSSIEYRDSPGDVGSTISLRSEKIRSALWEIGRANFLRVEEGLRVLEEFSKIISPEAGDDFKRLRFRVYHLEKAVMGEVRKPARIPKSPFLYAILDRSLVPAKKVEKVSEYLVRGGVGIIQYRAKGLSSEEMLRDIYLVKAAAGDSGIPVIVNDDPELAARCGADGVHVGKDDLNPSEAREILGPDFIIGVSIHSTDELAKANLDIVDYVAVGSIFTSPTKKKVKVVGREFIGRVRNRVNVPVVAIGGIETGNAESVFKAGADGIAVISALYRGDLKRNLFTFKGIIDKRLKDQ